MNNWVAIRWTLRESARWAQWRTQCSFPKMSHRGTFFSSVRQIRTNSTPSYLIHFLHSSPWASSSVALTSSSFVNDYFFLFIKIIPILDRRGRRSPCGPLGTCCCISSTRTDIFRDRYAHSKESSSVILHLTPYTQPDKSNSRTPSVPSKRGSSWGSGFCTCWCGAPASTWVLR